MKNLTILLVSPLDPKHKKKLKDLVGGENTYTQILLKYSFPGITFVHFEEAIKKNMILLQPMQNVPLLLQKFRLLPLGPRALFIKLQYTFDFVYAHGYPVKISPSVPLIVSDSSSSLVFIKYYLRWSALRILITSFIKKITFKIFDVVDCDLNTHRAHAAFVFSNWALLFESKAKKNLQVIYPGLPIPKLRPRIAAKNISILFVGVWFERKGGRIVLSVFRKLCKKYNNISLTILGELPQDIVIKKNEPIMHKSFVSYKQLQTYYRSHDILVHIPPVIEGYGMAVPEAMSYGMCPVVSDICVLPEFVDHQKSGLVIKAGSAIALEQALEKLIENPGLIKQYGNAARKRFIKQFSVSVFQKNLSKLFY